VALGVPGAIERGRDGFTLAVEDFPAVLGRLRRPIPCFPGAPVDVGARFGSRDRSKEERDGGPYRRTGNECEEHGAPAEVRLLL
jgi:hypothetical protein